MRINHRPFFILLAVGAILRLAMNSGVSSPDSFFYTQHAADLLQGKFNMGIQTYVDFYRYVVWMPITLFFKLFGINDMVAIMWPFLCGVGSLVVIYLLGNLLFNRTTAWLAVFILAFLPLEVIVSTSVLSDVFVEFFSGWAIFLFLRQELVSTRRSWVIYAFAGVLMGLAINARFSTVILGLFFAGYCLWKKAFRWHYVWFACGVIVVIVFSLAISWWCTGDWFFAYKVSNQWFRGLHATAKYDPAFQSYFETLSLTYYPRSLLGLSRYGLANFSFFFYLFLAAMIYSIAKKKKDMVILLIWVIPVFLFLQFGFIDLKNRIPIHHDERYLTIIIIPMVLSVAAFLSEWRVTSEVKSGKTSAGIVILLLIIFALSSLYGAFRIRKNLSVDASPYKLAYERLKLLPLKPIYCISRQWPLRLNFYFQYRLGYDYFENLRGGKLSYLKLVEGTPDYRSIQGYVVLHERYVYFDDYGHPLARRNDLPGYIYQLPAGWKLVDSFKTVDKGNTVSIYLCEP
ncbi:MAG: ArnT family glycosyltransferase [Candidatus Omnitrophota bacterium]